MIATHKGEIPFITLLLPFLAGIGLGINFIPASVSTLLSIALYSLITLFIGLNFFYKRLSLYKIKWLGGVLINSILSLLGIVVTINYNELNNKNHFSKIPSDYQIIKITNEPKSTNGGIRFTASVEANVKNGQTTPASGNLLVTIRDSAAKSLYYGDELMIPSGYQPVDPPYNPAEFNYKRYLANQNIHYHVYLPEPRFYILNKNTGNSIIAYSLRLRQQLVEKFKKDMHNPEAIAVASTLILGYKADLSDEVLQAYSKTGTIHVLSVSGAHVAILFILLSFALSFLDKFRHGKLIKAVIIVLLIWYYALLTGFSPAVCRAAVMISIVIIGKTYSRHINTLNILAVSAFFLLLYNPLFIVDVGFQLSYLAVFGLIVLQPVVYNWFDIENKWADKLWALCSVSIAAQVITFPLSAYYFHQFPVYFLVSNLFIIIPSAIIMYAGIAYLALPAIPFASPALAWVLENSILLMNKALAFIEHAPWSGINKIWITNTEYLLLYGIIISLFYFLYEKRTWLLKLSLGFILLLAISVTLKRWNNLRDNNITFLSLRKHTGIVFKAADRAVVLSDLTDTDKTYRYSVQPYLDSCQIGAVKLLSPTADIQLPFLLKRSNLVQFRDKTLLMFDRSLQNPVLPRKLKLDYLNISDNPAADIGFINKYYNYLLLIVDNSNSNTLITSLQDAAKAVHVNCVVLRRNKAIILSSN